MAWSRYQAGNDANQLRGFDRFRDVGLEPDFQGTLSVELARVGGERDCRQVNVK